MTVESLWGELPETDLRRGPKQILQEQAMLLGDATKNILEGSVQSSIGDFQNTITLRLSIVAKLLGNYRFEVLTATYDPVKLYPVDLLGYDTENVRHVKDESGLKNELKRIFQSKQVRAAISALLRQCKDEESSSPNKAILSSLKRRTIR